MIIAVSLCTEKQKNTYCHDDTCQDFPPSMRGREVVSQFTELVNDQTRDGVCQDLRWRPKEKLLLSRMKQNFKSVDKIENVVYFDFFLLSCFWWYELPNSRMPKLDKSQWTLYFICSETLSESVSKEYRTGLIDGKDPSSLHQSRTCSVSKTVT